ncbi:LamG domain-containing protein [Candidatus Poribacteria bacterium]|nr:LamG domain-containing protein [Candidatus Poribacteria bacterium]
MLLKVRLILVCIVTLVISALFAGLSYPKIDSTSIAAVWLFNEGKGDAAKDSSGNGNDGKLTNGPTWVKGKFDMALQFDGKDDFVDVEDTDELSGSDGKKLTVVAWFKTTKIEGTDNTPIVTKYLSASEKDWGLTVDSGKLKFAYETVGAGVDFEVNAPSMGGVVELDKWYHGAFVLDRKAVKVYLDGAEVAAATIPTETPNTDVNVAIGAVVYRNNYYQGLIDEVAVINAVLSQEDISTIMNDGLQQALSVSRAGKLTVTWGSIKEKD